MESHMVMENFILKIKIFCRDLLFMEDVKERVDSLNLMGVITKGILRTMWLTDMGSMLGKKDLDMKASGKIMFQMAKEKPHTQMDQGM